MARVIRREVFKSGRSFSLSDVSVQADALIERARDKAEALLRDVGRQADELFEQRKAEGYRTGFDEGRAAGLASLDRQTRQEAARSAQKKMDELNSVLAQALTAFDADKRRMLAAAESGVIELACSIARRVCKAIPDMSLDAARANVRAALGLVKHEHDVRLHVNPADLDGLREFSADLCRQIDGFEHVELVADDAVARGGCVLRGQSGSIDASIDSQLAHVVESLLHAPERTDKS